MASTDQHIALANRHQSTLAVLLADAAAHPEWVTIVAFYKALQLVDACLAVLGESPPSTHGERKRALLGTRQMSNIWKHYRDLKNASMVARYLTGDDRRKYSSFAAFISGSKAESTMVRHRLVQIEKSAKKILKKAADPLAPAVPSS